VSGARVGESADTTISLANYVQHQKVSVHMDQHGHVIGTEIREKLRSFIEARRRARELT
jgi:hypothetical protein